MKRSEVFLVLFVVAGGVWIVLSYWFMLEAQVAASDSLQNRFRMEALARAMENLQNRADQAQYGIDAEDLSGRSARELCTQAQIPVDRIVEIAPKRSRIGNKSAYDREEMVFRFRDVTAEQVMRLMIVAENAGKAFSATHFQLKPPNRGGVSADSTSQETWDAEVTLTRLVFITKSPSDSIRSGR